MYIYIHTHVYDIYILILVRPNEPRPWNIAVIGSYSEDKRMIGSCSTLVYPSRLESIVNPYYMYICIETESIITQILGKL